MDHFEALQKLLNQYKRGLMTPEEYEGFVSDEIRQEVLKQDTAEMQEMTRKYGR